MEGGNRLAGGQLFGGEHLFSRHLQPEGQAVAAGGSIFQKIRGRYTVGGNLNGLIQRGGGMPGALFLAGKGQAIGLQGLLSIGQFCLGLGQLRANRVQLRLSIGKLRPGLFQVAFRLSPGGFFRFQ